MKNKEVDEVCEKTYFKMLNFLSFRLRSNGETVKRLDFYLSKIRLPLREIDEVKMKVLERLRDSDYIKDSNDLDFSLSYVKGLTDSGRSINKVKIRQYLLRKDISNDIIEKALGIVGDDIIYKSAFKEAEKKLRSLKAEDKRVKKKKLLNFLYRKGYPFDIATSVVDTLL